jgi:YesN/AraC family two-component response regulator
VTDQVMPGMTGLDLIASIKNEWPSISVLLASGYAEFPEGADVAVPRLAKPFNQAALANALAKLLADRTVVQFSLRRSP